MKRKWGKKRGSREEGRRNGRIREMRGESGRKEVRRGGEEKRTGKKIFSFASII